MEESNEGYFGVKGLHANSWISHSLLQPYNPHALRWGNNYLIDGKSVVLGDIVDSREIAHFLLEVLKVAGKFCQTYSWFFPVAGGLISSIKGYHHVEYILWLGHRGGGGHSLPLAENNRLVLPISPWARPNLRLNSADQIQHRFLVRLISEVYKITWWTFQMSSLSPFWRPCLKMAAIINAKIWQLLN
jgi:hypothetical protein